MADDLDNMSDADIRTRLSEFGFPVVPITATTRKTMVKKLKMLLENQKQISNSNRMSLAKYSSGEESDVDTNKTKTDKSRRYTMGQMLPPTNTKKGTPRKISPVHTAPVEPIPPTRQTRRTIARDLSNDLENDNSGGEEGSRSRRVTRFYKTTTKVTNDINPAYNDSVSDSDDDIQTVEGTRRDSPVITRSSPTRRDSPILSSLRSSPQTQSVTNSDLSSWKTESDGYKSVTTGLDFKTLSGRSSYSSGSIRHISEKLDRSLSDKYSAGTQLNVDDNSGDKDGGLDKYESPFLSEFTRRLESTKRQYSTLTPHRSSTILSDDSGISYSSARDVRNTPVNNVQNNYRALSSSFSRRVPPPTGRSNMAFDNIFKKSNVIPLILVVAFATFFAFVGFLYIGMKGKPMFQIDAKDHNIPICQPAVSSTGSYTPGNPPRPGINCIQEASVKPALQLFRYISSELNNRAIENACQNPQIQPFMTKTDVIEFVKKENSNVEDQRVLSDLDNLHVLILKNPQWGASVVEITDNTVITNLDAMLKSDTYYNMGIVMLNPDLPLSCVFSKKIVNIVYTVALVLSGLIVAIGLQFIIKFGLKKREERNKAVYSMVERIVEVLSQEAGDGDDSYLAINHVRDRLILPQERKNMNKIWDDAVYFLEQNDSRVRSEVQNVAGEDCRVWRWLAMGNHSAGPSSPRNKNKVWQGQAFETQEGSVNNLPVSPTPCLKIRQMIDKHDDVPNLKLIIQDAILEKCGDDCNILHIHVDQQMLCVYVKCASRKDAGLAYRRLHGCWFDGKLITVKYVRLERYMERFPDSPINPPFLSPSNNKKSSLQFFKMDNSDNL